MSATLVLLLMMIVTVNSKQLLCGWSFRINEEQILTGHVISTHQVHSFPECQKLCLDHPRCLSSNYKVVPNSSSHVCELNDATKTMCPHDMIKTTGYKYHEEVNKAETWGRQCPPRDVDGTNVQITFPLKSIEDYVRFDLHGCAPPLTAFTVCLWLKGDDADEYRGIFSYSLPNQSNEILLNNMPDLWFFVASSKRSTNIAVNNGLWRHICTTWENAAGSWKLYIDGALSASGDDLRTGHVLENNGIFILGQDQDSYGGGFEQDQSFYGQMYGVNMWNRVLTAQEILHMAGNCSYGVGNYLRWNDFLIGLHGNVFKTYPATCLP